MKQEIPKNINGISTLAISAIKGLEENGVTIGIKYCTAAVLTAARTMAMAALLLFDTGKQVLRDKRDALIAARDTARAFATAARDLLKPILGSEYNDRWDIAGFVDSLAIPLRIEDLLPVMEKLVAYLTNNPALEVAVRNITAAQAQIVYDALKGAFNDVTTQEAALKVLKNDRDMQFDGLRNQIGVLIEELSFRLQPLDPRWTAFGFNMPGAQETPDQVQHVQVTLLGPTAAAVKWPASARADYYRVWTRVVGTTDTEPTSVGSPADLDFTIENLPVNSTIEVYLTALNNGGESPLSEKITITTHA